MTKQELMARLDAVIAKGQATLESVPPMPPGRQAFDPEDRWVKPDVAAAFRTAGLTLLRSIYGTDHQIYKDFETQTHDKNTLASYRRPVGVIETVREEVDHGWLEDARALIAADIFANMLEMSDYFLGGDCGGISLVYVSSWFPERWIL